MIVAMLGLGSSAFSPAALVATSPAAAAVAERGILFAPRTPPEREVTPQLPAGDTSNDPLNLGSAGSTSSPALNQAIFMATHNSYSGGERRGGSFTAQLDSGVRFLELDVHRNSLGAFVIGHGRAGAEVDHSGSNPDTNLLSSWLQVIRDWSRSHANHAPIQVLLDMKVNLAGVRSYEEGNLGALQATCLEIFGRSLILSETVPSRESWKNVDELRNKIFVVLSGDKTARELYLHDRGYFPSVALNKVGRVVEVHASGVRRTSRLWYWTGQMDSSGVVMWHRHGSYDTGTTPAVVVRDDGTVIEVHKSENYDELWCRVGSLRSDFGIDWGNSVKFTTGKDPSLVLRADGSIHEIHTSENTNLNWESSGTVNVATKTIQWHGYARTDAERYSTSRAHTLGWILTVFKGSPSDTLHYSSSNSSHDGAARRIRYPQVLFAETQPAHDAIDSIPKTESLVCAASASWTDSLRDCRMNGYLTRAWDFDSPSDAQNQQRMSRPVNYAATNELNSDWYQTYSTSLGALQ
mmetsp:Transcript_30888/g.51118  ORF Transcript_30888/g.51118 Transcript_30888/m.51118 type:complete len:522 (+) Transcript_30888:3-1568(+)